MKKAVQEEEERLDNERQMQLERISADYHDELEQMKMELQEEQEDKMESVRNELMAKHEMVKHCIKTRFFIRNMKKYIYYFHSFVFIYSLMISTIK